MFGLGIAETILMRETWFSHVIGMLAVSVFLELLFLLSKGKAIGGGDIKLMAAAGLLLGWEKILLAFGIILYHRSNICQHENMNKYVVFCKQNVNFIF